MKKVFVIHGYTGHPEKNWFPWLKSELQKIDISVTVLSMPHADNPQYSEWLNYLKSQITPPDIGTYLVGHSLGCITILQYLNNLPVGTQIGGAVLVAGFASPIHLAVLNSFFDFPLDDAKVIKNVKNIVAINSDNDPHVPYHQAEELKSRFGADLIKVPSGGHLNEKAGYKQFPLVLEKLIEIMTK